MRLQTMKMSKKHPSNRDRTSDLGLCSWFHPVPPYHCISRASGTPSPAQRSLHSGPGRLPRSGGWRSHCVFIVIYRVLVVLVLAFAAYAVHYPFRRPLLPRPLAASTSTSSTRAPVSSRPPSPPCSTTSRKTAKPIGLLNCLQRTSHGFESPPSLSLLVFARRS